MSEDGAGVEDREPGAELVVADLRAANVRPAPGNTGAELVDVVVRHRLDRIGQFRHITPEAMRRASYALPVAYHIVHAGHGVDMATVDRGPHPSWEAACEALLAARAAAPLLTSIDPTTGLSGLQRAVLDFAKRHYRFAAVREQDIRAEFDCSATEFYQLLNAVIDLPGAWVYSPAQVKALRAMRERRRRQRSARAASPRAEGGGLDGEATADIADA